MKELVRSIKRLYVGGRLSLEQIERLYSENKITEEEMKYILA